jgi:hypothetical protein
MAASSGFYRSPEPLPLGDALGIATAHPQGHKNSQQRRCILFSSSISASTINVAK